MVPPVVLGGRLGSTTPPIPAPVPAAGLTGEFAAGVGAPVSSGPVSRIFSADGLVVSVIEAAALSGRDVADRVTASVGLASVDGVPVEPVISVPPHFWFERQTALGNGGS